MQRKLLNCLPEDIRKYFLIYPYHGSGLRGLKRCLDTFFEVDLFDYLRKFINTRENIRDGYSNSNYMFYAPVYTQTCKEMIFTAHDYWSSAVKYTNFSAKTVFVDLGCGSGKSLIQALEANKFNSVFGVELQTKLVDRCESNIRKMRFRKSTEVAVFENNVEDKTWIESIAKISKPEEDTTLFIFNKNSYDGEILAKTLDIAETHFNKIIYLYQNPIHSEVLIEKGYKMFSMDSRKFSENKNFKYKLYIK